jgi:hypothetical protein
LVNKCKKINPYHEKELNNLGIFTKKGVARLPATPQRRIYLKLLPAMNIVSGI